MRHIKGIIRLAVLVAAASIMAAGGPAAAETRTWDGSVSNYWSTTGNWTPAGYPAESDNLRIYDGSPQTVSFVTTDSGGSITFDGETASGRFDDCFTVGSSGAGWLYIRNGGQVASLYAYIGYEVGSTGTVTVDAGTWTNSGSLSVGGYGGGSLTAGGTGLLTVSSGGLVENASGYIGFNPGSTGTVTVDGAGSSWNNSSSSLYVGYEGSGALTISNGGQVANTVADIGYLSISTGTVTVDNGTWTNSGSLYVGNHGSGDLSIRNGGLVENRNGLIARSLGTGAVTVDNATWTNSGHLSVGWSGSGELSISNGGVVTNLAGYIGRNAGSNGTVTVDGGTWTNSGSLYVGGVSLSAGGTGLLTVSNGGQVNVADTLKVWSPGTVNLLGGTLAAGTIDHTDGGAFNFTGGTLHVGTFQGNLTNAGGTLAPGSSPGTTVVTGDYTQQAAGALEIEIVGTAPGQWDVLDVTGAADLDGTLEVVLDGYTPAAGDSFEVLTYASRSGEFADTTGWQFDGNKALVKVYGANALTLVATYLGDATLDFYVDGLDYIAWSNNYKQLNKQWQDGDFTGGGYVDGLDYIIWSNNYRQGVPPAPGAVPEPAALALLGLGACLPLLRKRK